MSTSANILRNKYIKSPVGVVEKQYQLNYADVANQDTWRLCDSAEKLARVVLCDTPIDF